MSILFVEDEPTIREEFSEFLQLLTTKNVYTAKDGLDGVDKYKQYKPDIIYTDYDMPNMDGIDMINKIKEFDPDVKFCFVTASHHLEERASYMMQHLEPQALYFKPVNMMKMAEDLIVIENKIFGNNKE
jgi:YesN/AraC family two-component response regulator